MKPKYKAVLFDLDGTLLDTLDDLNNSGNYALKKCGYPTITRDQTRQFVGNGMALFITRALPAGHTEEEHSRVLATFKEHYAIHCKEKTRIYDGLENVLYRLGLAGVKTATVSNKGDFAVQELFDFYFRGLMDGAIGERPGLSKKPAPDLVKTMAAELGVDLADTVYVGDSDVDIATARNAGLPCISVTWGFRSEEFIREHGATTVVHNMDELCQALFE